MTGKVTEFKDEEIVQLWYQGVSRSEIQMRTSASAGHISDIIQREKKLVGEANVDALRRLAKAQPKDKSRTLVDIQRGTAFLNACYTNALDDEQVIECLPHIAEACKKSDKTLIELPLDIETKAAELKELESRRQAAEQAVVEAEKHRDEAVKRSNLTDEDLAKFNHVRDEFAKYGLPIELETLEKIANIVANAQEAGFDGKTLMSWASKNRSLRQENVRLQGANDELDSHRLKTQQLLEMEEDALEKKSELRDKVIKSERMGLGVPDLEVLTQAVFQVGMDNGMDGPTAVKKFVDDVNVSYDSVVGFARKIEVVRKEFGDLEGKFDKLKMENAPYKAAVDSLLALNAMDVNNHEIVSIKYIIDRNGSDGAGPVSLKELEDDIGKYGSVKSAVSVLEKEKNELATSNQRLKSENSLLSAQNEGIKKAGENAQEIFRMVEENYAKVIDSATNTFIVNMAKSGKIMEKKYEDSGNRVRQSADDIKQYLDGVKLELQKLLSVKGFLQFEPLVRAGRGDKVSQRAIANAIIGAIDRAEPYLDNTVLESSKQYLRSARQELIRSLATFPTMLD